MSHYPDYKDVMRKARETGVSPYVSPLLQEYIEKQKIEGVKYVKKIQFGAARDPERPDPCGKCGYRPAFCQCKPTNEEKNEETKSKFSGAQ